MIGQELDAVGLEKMVELSHLPDMYEPKAVVPRTAKLYTKQEYSEKFILILEGRALVTIGQAEMTFEAGPWHAFGTEMLEHLVARSDIDSRALGDIEQSGSSLCSDNNKRLGFVPDFSVVVRDECTFLEITAHNWLAAYRSTLMSRGEPRTSFTADGLRAANAVDDDIPWRNGGQQSKRNSLISPQIEFVRRNGKTRSSSESERMELLPHSSSITMSPMSDRFLYVIGDQRPLIYVAFFRFVMTDHCSSAGQNPSSFDLFVASSLGEPYTPYRGSSKTASFTADGLRAANATDDDISWRNSGQQLE